MTQLIKGLATRPGDLCSIPWDTHDGKRMDSCKLLYDLNTCLVAHALPLPAFLHMWNLRSRKGHESRVSTRKVKPDRKGRERQERWIENVNMVGVHYVKELKVVTKFLALYS